MADFSVNGIVSSRRKQPSVQPSNENGMIAQLSMRTPTRPPSWLC